MHTTSRLKASRARRATPLIAVALALLVAGIVAGCGSSVPSNAVANVNGTLITKASFDHWLQSAAKQQAQQSGASGASVVAPDPPNFTKCIAAQQQAAAAAGGTKPSASQLKQQCQQQYNALRDETMQFLISAQWLVQEAKDRNITVSNAEVMKTFNQQKQQAFPNQAQYQQFLKSSGQTQDDLLFRVRLSLLTNKLQQKIAGNVQKATPAQVQAYYNQNRAHFGKPESRNLLVVLTPSQSQAQAALKALNSGQPWAQVTKKYSTDAASKSKGGQLNNVTPGQQEQAFDKAIFAAPKNKVEGPVKTEFGYYVFKVVSITPGTQQTLAQATPSIEALLKSQRQQNALNAFVKSFEKKHKSQTQCGSGYEVAQYCANAKSSSSSSAPGAGGGASGAGGGASGAGGGASGAGGGASGAGGGASGSSSGP